MTTRAGKTVSFGCRDFIGMFVRIDPILAGGWPLYMVWWFCSPKLRTSFRPHKIAKPDSLKDGEG